MPHKCGVVWSSNARSMETVWSMELERIQRRATKFVLSLPFQTDMPHKTRLAALKMLPVCYWHEYLDILFLFKCTHGLVKTDTLPEEVDTLTSTINLRSLNNSLLKYNIPEVRTLSHQNSYLVRVLRVWNSLPDELRKPELSFQNFKSLTAKQNLLTAKVTKSINRFSRVYYI